MLRAGDTLELFIGNAWQWVHLESGGYKSWYYVTADGQRARFAVAMQIRRHQVAVCPVAAPEQESVPEQVRKHPQRSRRSGKRMRGTKREVVIASMETLPSGVQLVHLTKHIDGRQEQSS